MRRTLTTVLVGCALLLAGWVTAPPAAACSCADLSTAERFAAADAVFTGTLVSREVQRRPGGLSSSGDPAVHVFALDTLYKGTADSHQQVVSADSGASCGLELAGDGPFLVFATDPADLPEGQLAAGLCGGSAPLTPELAAGVADLASSTGDPGAVGPIDPAMSSGPDAGAGAGVGVGLQVGAALATLLVGVLVVLRRRRTERRSTVVVLGRD